MQSLSRVHAKVLPCAAHQHAGHELQHLLAVPLLEVRDEQLGHDAAVHVAAALTTEGLQGRKGAGHTSVHHTSTLTHHTKSSTSHHPLPVPPSPMPPLAPASAPGPGPVHGAACRTPRPCGAQTPGGDLPRLERRQQRPRAAARQPPHPAHRGGQVHAVGSVASCSLHTLETQRGGEEGRREGAALGWLEHVLTRSPQPCITCSLHRASASSSCSRADLAVTARTYRRGGMEQV